MQLDKLSIVDGYYLGNAVLDVIKKPECAKALDGEMKPVSPHWKTEIPAKVLAYRAATDKLFKEIAEARMAATDLMAFEKRFHAWRRYLKRTVDKLKDSDPDKYRVLLAAIGYGAGSTDSSKEAKDFLVDIGNSVDANRDRLEKLGASEESLKFAKVVQAQEEGASLRLAKENADVRIARRAMRGDFTALKSALALVWTSANAARDAGEFEEDGAAKLDAAEKLIIQLEEAEAQARVLSRKRATDDQLPPEVTTPVEPEPAPV